MSGTRAENTAKKVKTEHIPSVAVTGASDGKARVRGVNSGEVSVDLRESKYRGFVIPANVATTRDKLFARMEGKSDAQKQETFEREWPLCAIGTDEEAFPFRAKPLLKKPKLEELSHHVGGNIEGVRVDELLRKVGYKTIYVNEEGKNINLEFNPDATAFAENKADSLVGDAVVCK